MSLKNLAKQVRKEQKACSLTTEELFISAIDKYLVENAGHKSLRLAFQPSSYYRCQRALFYSLTGVSENKKVYPRGQRTLQIGTELHDWIQDMLAAIDKTKLGIKLLPVEEMPFYQAQGVEIIENHRSNPIEIKFLDKRWTEKYPVSAMIDGAFEFMNRQMIFEFKTINADDFKLLIEPLKDHVKQGAVYALCTGIYRVMFLYLNKNDSNFKAYLVEYTEEQLEWVKSRIRYIEKCLIDGSLPDKEDYGDNCKWCGYKGLCGSNLKEACHF